MNITKNQAMQGNTRAQHGEEPKTSFLMIRVTPQQKAAYVHASNERKLSDWVTETLDAAAKQE